MQPAVSHPMDAIAAATAPLLGADGASPIVPWHDTRAWRAVHAAAFALGGTTFIAGTACLYPPPTDALNDAAAALYTAGSLGFLVVDVLEFCTFTDAPLLRANIALSAAGSALYVLGSVGFFPIVATWSPSLGVAGFIGGSALIAVSQTWKTARLSCDAESGRASGATLLRVAGSAAGVEASAGLGATCFLVGTAMYAVGPLAGTWLATILAIWVAGSVFFTVGAGFLAFRHFWLCVT